MSIVLIDTSVLCNLLNVPGKADECPGITRKFKRLASEGGSASAVVLEPVLREVLAERRFDYRGESHTLSAEAFGRVVAALHRSAGKTTPSVIFLQAAGAFTEYSR
ncbi:hypothetical protein [Endothiovibrio diazotrophicus]